MDIIISKIIKLSEYFSYGKDYNPAAPVNSMQ